MFGSLSRRSGGFQERYGRTRKRTTDSIEEERVDFACTIHLVLFCAFNFLGDLFCSPVQRGPWLESSLLLWSHSCPNAVLDTSQKTFAQSLCLQSFALAFFSTNCAFGFPCFVSLCRRCSVMPFSFFCQGWENPCRGKIIPALFVVSLRLRSHGNLKIIPLPFSLSLFGGGITEISAMVSLRTFRCPGATPTNSGNDACTARSHSSVG